MATSGPRTPPTNDLFKFDQFGDELAATFVPVPIGLTIWGVDNPNPSMQDTQDYYSFSLTVGQSATIVAKSLNGQNVQISIVDRNGDVLATGVGGSTNVSESIENFVATSSGTYYVEITGDPGLQYSLVVTRGATFTIQPHNSISTAENVTGTNGVLGNLAPPIASLYTLDDQQGNFGNAQNPIWATDPTTGAFIGTPIYAPGNSFNNPFGQNLAFDGTYLYYNNGQSLGDNTIYKIDPTTGNVVASGTLTGVPLLTGLAYLNGELYGIASFNSDLYEIDPSTFQLIKTIPTGLDPSAPSPKAWRVTRTWVCSLPWLRRISIPVLFTRSIPQRVQSSIQRPITVKVPSSRTSPMPTAS